MAPGEDLIDRIYDASLDPARWAGVMEALCDEVGGNAACLTELDIIDGSGSALTSRTDDNTLDDYMQNWTDRNPLQLVSDPLAYIRDWRIAILRDREWMPPEILHKTAYYNEFLRPIGADHSIMMRLSLDGTVVTALNIARSNRKGIFEDYEIARVARYQTHIIRATTLGHRLRVTSTALSQIDTLLEASAKILFFVDRRGTVRSLTAAAERMLGESKALTVRQGKLVATEPEIDARLQRLIAEAIARSDTAGDPSLVVRSGRDDKAWTVSAVALGSHSVASFSGEPLTLVGVTELPAVISPADRLRSIYQLTGAEARVALMLGDGLKIRQVAAELGSSVHTVRAQLGAVFAKTGCHRQADLVRMLLGHDMVAPRRLS